MQLTTFNTDISNHKSTFSRNKMLTAQGHFSQHCYNEDCFYKFYLDKFNQLIFLIIIANASLIWDFFPLNPTKYCTSRWNLNTQKSHGDKNNRSMNQISIFSIYRYKKIYVFLNRIFFFLQET